MAEFRLGTYTFDTEEEYNIARKEVSLIKQIKEKYDLTNPQVLDAITKKFNPQTVIGKDFINVIEKKRMEHHNLSILNDIDKEIVKASLNEPSIRSSQQDSTIQSQASNQHKKEDNNKAEQETKQSDDRPIWYYRSQSKETKGPLTEKQIEDLIIQGAINVSTLARRYDWEADKWVNIGSTSLSKYFPPMVRAAEHYVPQVLNGVIRGIRTQAILWTITAGFQLLIASIGIMIALLVDDGSAGNYLLITIFGVWNLISSIIDFQYCKRLKTNCTGLVERAQVTIRTVIYYIYNSCIACYLLYKGGILLVMGGLTIATLIVDGVCYRRYVNKHRSELLSIESLDSRI